MNASAAPQSPDIRQATVEAPTLELLAGLRTLAADTLGRGIERMFDGADDMLFEMARRATNNKDQRIYFDTMRVVRLGRPEIGRIFREQIAAGFQPESDKAHADDDIAFEDLSLQESRSLEESIAVSSMATKAENLYGHLLFELGRRLEWLIKEKGAPISPAALAPATISAAFQRSAEVLDVEFDIELVIFKLFDRLVISDLGELYNRVLRFMDQAGVKPAAISAAAPRPASPHAGPGAVTALHSSQPPLAQGYGFAQPPMMDAATLDALRRLVSSDGYAPTAVAAGPYGDVQLGSDLATAAAGQIVPGWEAPRAYAYVQRAGAVGQMFNELMQDPSLPAPLKPRFDQLRFSVIKSALHDASFFADRQHPVRGLMSELATLAAGARTSGMEALRRIEELVGQIQGQFEVAADDVRSQTALPGALDEKTLEQFFAQQKEDARQRRQAIIERTRRVVAEELQLRTLGRRIPAPAWPLLNSGWAPLAALRLLKQGADSEGWQEAIALLLRLLDSVDPRPAARGPVELDQLGQELAARLAEIGMIDERIQALLRSWREAVAEVERATVDTQPGALTSPVTVDAVPPLPGAIPFEPGTPDPDADGLQDLAASSAATARAPVPGEEGSAPASQAPGDAPPEAELDAVALLDLMMVLSSWFRVYDHDRGQNRWLKVVAHHPDDGTVTFAEFNGQNTLQLRAQVFLDDLVVGRAEPIDLGPAARRSLDAYLGARRAADPATAQAA